MPVRLADYERAGGYQAVRKVLGQLSPAEVTGIVMKSGLRGRGGAGFPTGVKWGFLPKDYQGLATSAAMPTRASRARSKIASSSNATRINCWKEC